MGHNAAVKPSANLEAAPAVLVIDDDQVMRDLMADWLEAAGYRVLKSGGCEEAMVQVKLHQPAVVVTDMFMPGPCGEEAIAQIRQAAPGVAIVAVSGNFDSGNRCAVGQALARRVRGLCGDNALAAGANRALAKPVQRREFLQAVAELVGPAAAR
jgi:CheY-like chemotaxis protein